MGAGASEGTGASEKTRDTGNKVKAKARAANGCPEVKLKVGIGFFSIVVSFCYLCGGKKGPLLGKQSRVSHDNSRETVSVHFTWYEILVRPKTV